jgi:hypothetical protein
MAARYRRWSQAAVVRLLAPLHEQPPVVLSLTISARRSRCRLSSDRVRGRSRCEPGTDQRRAHTSANPMTATVRARVTPSVFHSIRIGPPRMRAPRPRRRRRPCSCSASPPGRSRDRLRLVRVRDECGQRQLVVDSQRLESHGGSDADLVRVRVENRREQSWTLR